MVLGRLNKKRYRCKTLSAFLVMSALRLQLRTLLNIFSPSVDVSTKINVYNVSTYGVTIAKIKKNQQHQENVFVV